MNDPGAIERVLVHDNENYVKGDIVQRTLDSITGQGILLSEGETWRRNRRRVQPAFHPRRIEGFGRAMTTAAGETADGWSDGETVDVHAELMSLTLRIVGEALFGVDVEADAPRIGEALETLAVAVENAPADLLPGWVPTPARRRAARATATIDAVVDRIVAERRRDPGDDVVSMLLAAEEPMTDEEIRAEVRTLLLAGHETTALALTFTLWLVAQHPAVEATLLAELDPLDGAPPTVEDLAAMPYHEQVVEESMRLYPPVYGIVRQPVTDVAVAGYRIPAGVTVAINQWSVHRDPALFDDPVAFVPDRWSESFRAALPRFAYFPFGGGPRRCVGDRFALLESRLLLATLLGRFHFELVSAPVLDLGATVTSRPREPVLMRLRTRDGDGVPRSRTGDAPSE